MYLILLLPETAKTSGRGLFEKHNKPTMLRKQDGKPQPQEENDGVAQWAGLGKLRPRQPGKG